MPESIESMQRPPLEVVELPTDKLVPDPANPNRLDERRMQAMRKDIQDHGFVQTVVVRPDGEGRWRITDGEHRWRILKEIGEATTPCIIDDADNDAGHMRMLTMNQLRGSFDPVRLGNVLARLAEQLDSEELRERLGMDEEEYDSTLSLAGTDGLDDAMAKALDRENKDAPEVVRFRMGPRQARSVENAVEQITAEGATRGEALIQILEGKEKK